jgi:hypothetical protein
MTGSRSDQQRDDDNHVVQKGDKVVLSEEEEGAKENVVDNHSNTTTTTLVLLSSSSSSHFQNVDTHPTWLRWSIPIYFLLTFALLLASHLGSGVRADYILIQNPGRQIVEQRPLLTASIFSSVKELWYNESYPLAIFICVASITWPYIKLLLSVWAWMTSYSLMSSSSSSAAAAAASNPSSSNNHTTDETNNNTNSSTGATTTMTMTLNQQQEQQQQQLFRLMKRREILLEVLDSVGKWSFVDIIVLVEIMVAFRSTIVLSPLVGLEIVIVPEWGFYGFVRFDSFPFSFSFSFRCNPSICFGF